MIASASPEASAQLRSGRVLELDGLRAFAILPVMIYHCYPENKGWITLAGQAGWIGVDLFFVLSGYLITSIVLNTLGQPHFYRNFIVRRTIRIFPLYYLCLLLFTASVYWAGGEALAGMQRWGSPAWFAVYLGNIRGAIAGFPPVFSFVPLWTLQVEEQFYLTYPVIAKVCSRRSLGRFLVGCLIAAPLLRSSLLLVPHSDIARYILMPCRMDALALGGLVALMMRAPAGLRGRMGQVRFTAIFAGMLALSVYAFAWSRDAENVIYHPLMSSIGYTLIDLTCAAVLALIVMNPSTLPVRMLRWRPLVYTGQIAYGLYLLHGPAGWAARRAIARLGGVEIAPHSILGVPVLLVAGFAAAALSWHFFELPILGLKTRLTRS